MLMPPPHSQMCAMELYRFNSAGVVTLRFSSTSPRIPAELPTAFQYFDDLQF